MLSLFNSSECFFRLSTKNVTSQYNTSFWLLLKRRVLEVLCTWVASVLLTTNLTPFLGLELVFTDVLIWNKFVPSMIQLQAQKFLAPIHWWVTCKLAGNGIKRLTLEAEASEQLTLQTRQQLTRTSPGGPGRMAIISGWSGESRQEKLWGKWLSAQLDP